MGLFGDLLEDTGLSGLLSDGRWITLRSNGKRIKLDSEKRIVAGLPSKFHGVHVGDLSKLSHGERELLGIDCDDLRGHCHTCKKTFRSKDEAFAALMRANPELHTLQQSEFGQYDMAWLKWNRNGRRGKKPKTPITDGRLDSINEFYDLRGAARVGSFTEAVYYTIPSSRRWEDLPPRLAQLEEAAGFKLNPPDEATQAEIGKLAVEECEAEVDRQLAALFEKAKSGRLTDGDAAPTEHADHPGHVDGDLAPPTDGNEAPF